VYNLAAQSFVPTSWKQPVFTGDVTALGVTRMLEAIRTVDTGIRFYQASSSEMFGKAVETPQSETTPFHPRSPYAVGKVAAHHIAVNYRESYGMFTCSGILFNHESPRRGENFVTRKITRAVAAIELGLQDRLYLGNLDSRRDWGHARDYVEGMWQMLQQDAPGDYVLATGESHSVREFVERAFAEVGRSVEWRGRGKDERGYDAASGALLVEIDNRYHRPAEIDHLVGNPAKARKALGWRHKTSFEALVREMVAGDLEAVKRESERLNRHD
jgi:GDPmannose 4,6-dehydratase